MRIQLAITFILVLTFALAVKREVLYDDCMIKRGCYDLKKNAQFDKCTRSCDEKAYGVNPPKRNRKRKPSRNGNPKKLQKCLEPCHGPSTNSVKCAQRCLNKYGSVAQQKYHSCELKCSKKSSEKKMHMCSRRCYDKYPNGLVHTGAPDSAPPHSPSPQRLSAKEKKFNKCTARKCRTNDFYKAQRCHAKCEQKVYKKSKSWLDLTVKGYKCFKRIGCLKKKSTCDSHITCRDYVMLAKFEDSEVGFGQTIKTLDTCLAKKCYGKTADAGKCYLHCRLKAFGSKSTSLLRRVVKCETKHNCGGYGKDVVKCEKKCLKNQRASAMLNKCKKSKKPEAVTKCAMRSRAYYLLHRYSPPSSPSGPPPPSDTEDEDEDF